MRVNISELTPQQRLQIAYDHLMNGETQRSLADQYGTHQSNIHQMTKVLRAVLEWNND